MKLLALSALLCALMALALFADAAKSQPEEAKAASPDVPKKYSHKVAGKKWFFNWGNTHNNNSGNVDNKSNFGNTNNRKNFGNKNNTIFRNNTHGTSNSGIHFAMEKRTFCWPWRRWTKIGHRYFLYIRDLLTWHQAERKCISLGGHLASVHSAWEYQQIRNLIARHNRHHPRAWIGGTDKHCEGHWKWSDGSCFNYRGWCCREPNNLGNEDCLEINFSAHKCWNDLQCHNKLPSVCVWKRK